MSLAVVKATMNSNQDTSKTVFVIAGPTAVGKTEISISLAERLNTCIISADSRQCYKEMTIGTAKPSSEELQHIRHYFIDDFSVIQNISAADYEEFSLKCLDEIFKNNDNAVVCGGTGLYIKALTEGLDEMPAVNEVIEAEVNREFREKGLAWLQDALRKEDPVFFELAEVQNPSRLIRALTFKRSTGSSIAEYRTGNKKQRPFHVIKCVLELPREELYERINTRVDVMMQQGLLEEVKKLLSYKNLKNLQTVGYTELFDYLEGKYDLEEAVSKIKQHTRNYAKRQLTWFRKDKDYYWLNVKDPMIVEKLLALKK